MKDKQITEIILDVIVERARISNAFLTIAKAKNITGKEVLEAKARLDECVQITRAVKKEMGI